MAVTITQSPGEWNGAFGILPVTLQGIAPAADKYVLQVRDTLGTTTYADVRQAPNQYGRALFDIQQILQNLLNPSPTGIETYGGWVSAVNELAEYRLYYGSETAGVLTIDGNVTGLKTIPVRKSPADINWNSSVDYRYEVSETAGCTNLLTQGYPLTDWDNVIPSTSFSGTKPARVTGDVLKVDLRATDAHSLSFIQQPIKSGLVTANHIAAAWVTSYDSAGTLVDDFLFWNIQPAGGGPDYAPLNNTPLVDPYWVVTLPTGWDSGIQSNLSPGVAYYWVTLHTQTGAACLSTHTQLLDTPCYTPVLYNIVEGDCNDFSPIQLSWENSLGFRDYWTFPKRHDRQVEIARNNYLQGSIDYNGQNVNPNAGARGYRTFSQQLTDKYIVRTDWLTDAQAAYLENLFISPDVRANLGSGFISVTLLTTSYVEKTVRKDRMFQYEIEFKTAYNINSQQG